MIIEQDVRNIIARSVTDESLASIGFEITFEEGGLDSLDHASILLNLQDEFDFVVPDEDVDKCNSIQAILEYAASKA